MGFSGKPLDFPKSQSLKIQPNSNQADLFTTNPPPFSRPTWFRRARPGCSPGQEPASTSTKGAQCAFTTGSCQRKAKALSRTSGAVGVTWSWVKNRNPPNGTLESGNMDQNLRPVGLILTHTHFGFRLKQKWAVGDLQQRQAHLDVQPTG